MEPAAGRSTSNCRSMSIEMGAFRGRQPAPSPAEAIALADELEWVLSQFDSVGRQVLELRLQGAKLSEIARDTGRSERKVRRILARVREVIGERFAMADDDRESRVPRSEQERQHKEPRRTCGLRAAFTFTSGGRLIPFATLPCSLTTSSFCNA